MFSVDLDDDLKNIRAEDCLFYDLNHELTVEITPYAALFEWLHDLLVLSGKA